jgi:hypothetical protein
MNNPVMVILAAGIGSRYGGLKQIDPVGPHGELIIDYSIYDSVKAGFKKVVFVIKREIEQDFREIIGDRISKHVEIAYAYQELGALPEGYSPPENRVKPWGTMHALLSAKEILDGPFAAINADDYYGPEAYKSLYGFLKDFASSGGDGKQHYAMVGYRIENTVTEAGSVARGVCKAGADGYLKDVVERTKVEKTDESARFSEDGGLSWTALPKGTLVSMNFWGFQPGLLALAERDFAAFLDKNLPVDPLKCEYLLPVYVGQLIKNGEADVKVLESGDVWHGITYREDRQGVMAAMEEKHKSGLYPTPLWG